MADYDIKDKPRFTATFTDLNGALTNPTTVVCKVRDPAGTITTPATVNSSTGVYYADYGSTLDLAGRWMVRFEGTGALVAAIEIDFEVEPSAFY